MNKIQKSSRLVRNSYTKIIENKKSLKIIKDQYTKIRKSMKIRQNVCVYETVNSYSYMKPSKRT